MLDNIRDNDEILNNLKSIIETRPKDLSSKNSEFSQEEQLFTKSILKVNNLDDLKNEQQRRYFFLLCMFYRTIKKSN